MCVQCLGPGVANPAAPFLIHLVFSLGHVINFQEGPPGRGRRGSWQKSGQRYISCLVEGASFGAWSWSFPVFSVFRCYESLISKLFLSRLLRSLNFFVWPRMIDSSVFGIRNFKLALCIVLYFANNFGSLILLPWACDTIKTSSTFVALC